jgi:hypothetical protein
MKLRVQRNGEIGMMLDENDIVRGLWFSDRERAGNPNDICSCIVMLKAMGQKFEENDEMPYVVGRHAGCRFPVEVANGGYIQRFLSAEKKWWQFWK